MIEGLLRIPEKLLMLTFSFFPKASLMLGFCFRFSLKVPGSDTSCDDGDKKGFPFRCAADRVCDAGWGCRPGVRGWLGGRWRGAGWVRKTGAVDARDKARGTLVTGRNRPERDWRGGRSGHAETARERDWRGGRL